MENCNKNTKTFTYSLSSRNVLFANISEVQSCEGRFTYNFFTNDEAVDELGLRRPSETQEELLAKGLLQTPDFNNSVARYVTLNWVQDSIGWRDPLRSPPRPDDGDVGDPFSSVVIASYAENPVEGGLQSIMDRGQIQTEEDLSSVEFRSYVYGNKQFEEVLNTFFMRRFTSFGLENASQLELFNMLSEQTTVKADTLQKFLPPSLKAPDYSNLEFSKLGIFRRQEGIQNEALMNSTFAPFMFGSAPLRGSTLYNLASISRLRESFRNEIENLNAYLGNNEFMFNFPVADFELRDPPVINVDEGDDPWVETLKTTECELVGFVFEKYRLFDGKKYPMPPLIVDGKFVRSLIDTEVASGITYEYHPRSVYRIKAFINPKLPNGITTLSLDGKQLYVTFYISSRRSAPVTVTCQEARIPMPPVDLTFIYNEDDQDQGLRISWAFPSNPQRDIKYFQVFRRKTTADAFELLGHLDFNDSIVRTENNEVIDPSLILDYDIPITSFSDTEFSAFSDYIYAVACKDARQNSSGYSQQYHVRYDANSKSIASEVISSEGAPKQYPNYYIDLPITFPSMIKDSSHRKCRVILDPSCLGLLNPESLGVVGKRMVGDIENDPKSRYVFQFLNLDKAQYENFKVVIQDKQKLNNIILNPPSELS